jgi:hypothetical protein
MQSNIPPYLTALIALGMTGCGAGPRMVPPKDLTSGSQVLEVTERSRASGMLADESFNLGSYKVINVDRDASSKSGFSVGGYSRSKTTTGYSYELDAGSKFKGACGSESKNKSVGLGGGSIDWNSTKITCQCEGENVAAKLELTGKEDTTEGELTLGETKYQLTPVKETDSTSFASGPAGFRVDSNDKSIAAVETIYPGRIWLGSEVTEHAKALSCVLVGLMLYVPPRED